jgi:PAS domain S-box-containing protein
MTVVGTGAVLSRSADAVSSEMWPAGLGAAALFGLTRRQRPLVLALVLLLATGSFLAGGRPWELALAQGAGVALEAWVITAVVTDRGRREPRLLDDDDFARLVIAIALGGLVAAACATVGAAVAGVEHWWLAPSGTFVGHASSALILLPFFMRTNRFSTLAPPLERACQWALLVVVTGAVFRPSDFPPLLFLVIAVLAWGALRLQLHEVQVELLFVVTAGTVMTSFGLGPLAEVPTEFELPADVPGIVLQAFFLSCALVTIPMTLLVGQQRTAAREARLERDKAASIVDSANLAIIGTDEIGRITLFNPGAQRLLGYDESDVLGQFTTMFHTPAAISQKAEELGVADDFTAVALALAEPDTPATDMRFLRKDGTERTHSMTLSRIVDDRGVVTGYVSTSEDVTDRVRAHDALVDALDTERRALERLREVDSVKDTFISTVSHELRTPITSMTGYLELLLDDGFGPLAEEQADALRRVDGNSRRLLSLIDDLLTLSRVHEDGLGLVRREVDLVAVVRTAYDVTAPAWAQRDLDVTLDVPAEPVPLTGDEDMLERVVVNLLSNAVKFTPDGGHVTTRLSASDGEAVLEVEDTGIGIPVEEQGRLFTRFFRASTAQDRAIPGSGLGLSIAGAIVESHGGRIEVESGEGAGTTIRAHLPRA